MADDRLDVQTVGAPPAPEDMRGPTGLAVALPIFGFVLLVLLVVVALGVVGGWLGLAFGLVILLLGIVAGIGFSQRAGRKLGSPPRLMSDRPDLAGSAGESASAAEELRPLAPYDLPPGAPARRGVMRRKPAVGAVRPRRPGAHPAPVQRRSPR
jgi:hypothetical protein